jgi:hypothetical protein
MVHSAQTMHQSCVKIRTIFEMSWIKHIHDPHNLGATSNAFKMIYVPTICLEQTVNLSWTDTNTVSKWTKTRFHMTHVTLEFYRVHEKWFLGLWYVWHKPCPDLASRLARSPHDWIVLSLEPHHLGVLPGAPNTISELEVRLAQIVHLPCIYTNTVSNWTKTRFPKAHII